METARHIRYLKMWLLSILFSIFLLGNISDSIAFYWPINCTYSAPVTQNGLSRYPNFTCWGENLWTMTLFDINATSPHSEVSTELRYLWSCSYTSRSTVARTITNLYCPWAVTTWNSATGATGATWATGETWALGASAYEGAVALGYTWTIFEWLESLRWPIGATGTTQIVFATGSEIFSGAVFSLQSENDDATLNASGTYIPLFAKKEWQILVSYQGMRNIIIMVFLFFFTIFIIYKISSWKKGL